MGRFQGPFGAWLFIIVLLRYWKGEPGMWIGIGLMTFAWIVGVVGDWYQDRKREKSN
jgi:hypothetical protein